MAFLICSTSCNRKKALHVKVPIITIIEFNEYYMVAYTLGGKSGLFLVVLKAHIFQKLLAFMSDHETNSNLLFLHFVTTVSKEDFECMMQHSKVEPLCFKI